MAEFDAHGNIRGSLFDGSVDLLQLAEEILDLRDGHPIPARNGTKETETRHRVGTQLIMMDIARSLRKIATAPVLHSYYRSKYADKATNQDLVI